MFAVKLKGKRIEVLLLSLSLRLRQDRPVPRLFQGQNVSNQLDPCRNPRKNAANPLRTLSENRLRGCASVSVAISPGKAARLHSNSFTESPARPLNAGAPR